MKNISAKEVLSIILVLIMAFGIAPTSAFANEELSAAAGQIAEEKPASLEERENGYEAAHNGAAADARKNSADDIVEHTTPANVGDNTLAATGQCGDNVYWTFNSSTGKLTISGTGEMYDNNPWNNLSPFYRNTSIKSLLFKSGVTSIGDYAFEFCSSLTSIEIPDSVTSIGEGAFQYCNSLTSIDIPDSVTNIGASSFENTGYYNNLLNWENNVLYIGNFLIEAKELNNNSYSIKDGTTIIADIAFSECRSLESINIPDSVKVVGQNSFYECVSLKRITVGSNNINYSSDYNGVLYNNNKTELCQYPIGNTRAIFEIPSTVTSINDYAFSGCSSLKCIEISNSVTSIGRAAFFDCSSLTCIMIPDSVTSIGGSAFCGCSSLTSIEIPDSVTSIGEDAFFECDNLVLSCYEGSYVQRYADERCITYILIDGNDPGLATTGQCGDNVYWQFDETTGKLTISGTGKMGYGLFNSPFSGISLIKSVVVNQGVTNIGYRAFTNCNNLESVTIPNSVELIEEAAFYGCENLTRIILPDGLKVIGEDAFYACTILENVILPDSLVEIGDGAFSKCVSLTEMIFPEGITRIGWGMFAYVEEIKATIPRSVTKIEENAFVYCDATIFCYENSYAHQFAIDNEIDFELIDGEATNVTVSFDPNGGTSDTVSIEVESGTTIPSIPIATRTGYKFDGWFTDKTNGIKVDETTVINEEMTLYAHWTAIKYTVKFYDDTVLLGLKQFTYDQTDTLSYNNSVPTKEGFDFLGWANTKDSVVYFANGTQVKNLASTDGAVVAFYAIWEEIIPEQPQTIVDDATGIKMDVAAGTYYGDVTMQVEEVLSGSSFVLAGKIDGASSTKVFSIKTLVGGQETQPNGNVTVKIPVPAGFNAAKCKIFYIDVANNRTVEVPVAVEGGYLIFTTNHFSDWAIVEISETHEQKPSVRSVSIGDVSLN